MGGGGGGEGGDHCDLFKIQSKLRFTPGSLQTPDSHLVLPLTWGEELVICLMLNEGHKYANKIKCSHLVQVDEQHHQSLTKVVVVGQTLVVLCWDVVEEMGCQGMVG